MPCDYVIYAILMQNANSRNGTFGLYLLYLLYGLKAGEILAPRNNSGRNGGFRAKNTLVHNDCDIL